MLTYATLSQTKYKIISLAKPFIDKYVLILAILAVGSSIAIAFVQTSSIKNFNISILENFLRILGGAAGGGALTKIVLNYTSRVRTTNSYKAINSRLIMISRQIHIDILGKSSQDHIFQRLSLCASSLNDCSDDIQEIRSSLRDKARQLDEKEKSQRNSNSNNEDCYIHSCFNYNMIRRYVIDLTSIYYQRAFDYITDKNVLDKLEQCNSNGLILLERIEGNYHESARLWHLDLFLECNLDLYKFLLGELGVYFKPEVEVRRPQRKA